ncbi:FkbM family methyltransferase [Methanoregula sp.]|uniref:FkbM family methyltransferase n=1 Tax=Methanoregula sp. TaxID=2052170 RepID=UPI003C7674E6
MTAPSYFTTADGVSFLKEPTPYRQIFDVPEYWFQDILPEDRVIDIGANVGAFCIRAARLSPSVTAVEPVTARILVENIRKNVAGVRVIEGGLGRSGSCTCSWDDCSVTVPGYTLSGIIRLAGGCDFLKCDCEGGEWLIRNGELDGIRRIEMELHVPPISGPPDMTLLDYISRDFDFEITRTPCHDALGVMGVLHATRKE